MEKLGVYNDFHKSIEASAAFLRDTKENNIFVNPMVREKAETEEEKSFREYLSNASGIHIEEMTWGRVIPKGKISATEAAQVSREDDRNTPHFGMDALLCAFVETPTAVELFQKARNMDWRNVEERTFATGGKIFDFTV